MAIAVASLSRGPRPRWAATALRAAGVASVCAVAGWIHLAHRPATLCPLRALTGLPCPFCGATTAAAAAGRLDLTGALRASPLAAVLAGAVVLRPSALAAWWYSQPARRRRLALGATLLVAELWQLARFGFLHW